MVVDYETGEVLNDLELLSGYEPTESMKTLVRDKIVMRKNHTWDRWQGVGVAKKRIKIAIDENEEIEQRNYIANGMKIMLEKRQKQREKERQGEVLQLCF